MKPFTRAQGFIPTPHGGIRKQKTNCPMFAVFDLKGKLWSKNWKLKNYCTV
jgi:hypothetical protein